MLHSPHGDFSMTVEGAIDASTRTFALRSAKFGRHEFTWDGGEMLHEQPADLWDRLTGRPPLVWKRLSDAKQEKASLAVAAAPPMAAAAPESAQAHASQVA